MTMKNEQNANLYDEIVKGRSLLDLYTSTIEENRVLRTLVYEAIHAHVNIDPAPTDKNIV